MRKNLHFTALSFQWYACVCPQKCHYGKKTAKTLEDTKHVPLEELIGEFCIEKAHLPKPGQTLQRWYLLQIQDTSSSPQTSAHPKILVQMTIQKDSQFDFSFKKDFSVSHVQHCK